MVSVYAQISRNNIQSGRVSIFFNRNKLPKLSPSIFFSNKTIESLTRYTNDDLTQDNNSANAVLYVFLTSISRVLAVANRTSDAIQLIPTILELEKKFDCAAFPLILIQVELITKEKQFFYTFYAMQAIAFHTYVFEFYIF